MDNYLLLFFLEEKPLLSDAEGSAKHMYILTCTFACKKPACFGTRCPK